MVWSGRPEGHFSSYSIFWFDSSESWLTCFYTVHGPKTHCPNRDGGTVHPLQNYPPVEVSPILLSLIPLPMMTPPLGSSISSLINLLYWCHGSWSSMERKSGLTWNLWNLSEGLSLPCTLHNCLRSSVLTLQIQQILYCLQEQLMFLLPCLVIQRTFLYLLFLPFPMMTTTTCFWASMWLVI